jgi:hypothetical protein
VQDLQRVVDVHELQPGVAAEHGRDHRLREIAGERGLGGGAEEGREPQHGGRDLGPPTPEATHVTLDVEDVAREGAPWDGPGLGVLGEDRGVAERRAVGRGGRAHDQLAQPAGALGGGEQLHRADDVVLFHRRTATTVRIGRAGDREMHHRFGAEVRDGPASGPRVGLDQLDIRQQAREGRGRVERIQADDAVDPGVRGEPGGDPGTEKAADPGDHDDPRRGRG